MDTETVQRTQRAAEMTDDNVLSATHCTTTHIDEIAHSKVVTTKCYPQRPAITAAVHGPTPNRPAAPQRDTNFPLTP